MLIASKDLIVAGQKYAAWHGLFNTSVDLGFKATRLIFLSASFCVVD